MTWTEMPDANKIRPMLRVRPKIPTYMYLEVL